MSDYIVKDTELTSVANAIRIKGGTNSQLVFPSGFVSAIGNISGGGGGGTTWQTVFEGSVTTEAQPEESIGTIEGVSEITANTIKVTFNGVEYTCEKVDDGYGDSTFTEYPFFIDSWGGLVLLHTQTAGTYSLKIEAQEGGGASDFSTAEVTITGPTEVNYLNVVGAMAVDYHDEEYPEDDESFSNGGTSITSNSVLRIVLYKGKAYVDLVPFSVQTVITVSGNIEATLVENRYIITGDCTITIS